MKRSLCIVLLLAAGFARADDRADRIAYWTTQYHGEDLVSGQFACKRPAIPGWSKTREDIAAVQQRLDAWRDCYRRFAANINDLTAAGKRIPSEVLDAMTPAELQRAQRHVDAVYAALIAQARKDAAQVAADEKAWEEGTRYYVESYRNPSRGLLAQVSAPRTIGTQTDWRLVGDAMRGTPPAPTGVLH
jgi:hypothetical protein